LHYVWLTVTQGIKAAEILERDHQIHCNLTLLFAFAQAVSCAEARVTLISPFVGRILDWHKKANPALTFTPDMDPGVISVRAIWNYYKRFGYKTTVMGASFRNVEQIEQLCGCDCLTIAPKLLEILKGKNAPVPAALTLDAAMKIDGEKVFIRGVDESRSAMTRLASDGR
jgi:transaldolase